MKCIERSVIIVSAILLCLACSSKNSNSVRLQQQKVAVPDTLLGRGQDLFSNELEDPGRSTWQKPDSVLLKFGNLEGLTIADIGAGSGYFTLQLAVAGANVVAVDIDENFLHHVEEEALKLPDEAGKITTRKTSPESPSLEAEEVDGILIVNTVYFLPERLEYFRQLWKGLRKGGRLVIVDFKSERSPVAPPDNMWVQSAGLLKELKQVGFSLQQFDEQTLPHQYIITAIKK